jgi:hypothetical protein
MEHPILFSGEMVRAILDGKKTQTRRVIKNINDCPYGKPGDCLWVREGLQRAKKLDFLGDDKWTTQYIATGTAVPYAPGAKEGWCGTALWQWKNKSISPILMPHWASRITLEITNIQVEKLQDITNKDAMEEGILSWYYEIQYDENSMYYWSPIEGSGAASKFSEMWNSVNAKRGYSWDSNPYVWVVEFKKI